MDHCTGAARPESGSALVPAVVFCMTVMALTASVIGAGLALQGETRAKSDVRNAQQAAESGIHYLVAKMSGPEGPALLVAGRTERVLRGSGPRALRYSVSLRSGSGDGIDNDGDGFLDEKDEKDTIEVVSTGTCAGVSRTVYVTLLARYRSPGIEAATYIANPAAAFDLDGAAFVISGRDVSMSGAETGALVAGIGVNGDPSLVMNEVRSNQEAQVLGAGGTPSVQEVPPLDLQGLLEDAARTASVTLEADGIYRATKGEWGTVAAPAVVYANGSVRISNGSGGAGLFVVNGDLTITGDYTWQGVIIVRGRVVFQGGGGTRRLVGALVVENDLVSEEGGARLSGTVDIVYSRETIDELAKVFSRYTVLNWREGPVPGAEALP